MAIWIVASRGAFDDRNELNPLCLQFVAKEAIDRAAVFLVGGVDGAQNVEVDSVLAQLPPTPHHLIESALLAAVDAVGIVKLARAVDAQADQEIVLLEKFAPFIIEKDAVGLKGVLHGLVRPAVLFDEFDGAPEKVELHQRRLAALPRHGHRGRAVRLEQLTDVGLERVVGHPVLFVRIQRLFGQEEAIRTVDIAGRPARLRKQVEGRRGVGWQWIGSYRKHVGSTFLLF